MLQSTVPTTQLAKVSIDPKFVELTADVLKILHTLFGTALRTYRTTSHLAFLVVFYERFYQQSTNIPEVLAVYYIYQQ